MARIQALIVALLPICASAQSLSERAAAAHRHKDYRQCAKLWSDFAGETKDPEEVVSALYNAACCFAQAGDKDNAFQFLNRLVELGYVERGNVNVQHLKSDADLQILHSDPRWETTMSGFEAGLDRYLELYRRAKARASHFNLGLAFESIRGNSGVVLNLSSPPFWSNLAFHLSLGIGTLHGITPSSTEEQVFDFFIGRFGVIDVIPVTRALRAYSEGGVLMVFPEKAISSSGANFGGYGLVGLEVVGFGTSVDSSIHIAAGYAICAARAERLVGSPYYAEGLIVEAGLRVYF